MEAQTPRQPIPDLIYDVGMHKGEDADFYLKKGFRVIGFEADPDLAAQCRGRFPGEIASGKLRIIEGAIVERGAGKGGTVKFHRNLGISAWGTVDEAWARRNERLGTTNETIEVPAIDFAACLKKHGVPHYMKIDIEGSDRICLSSLLAVEAKPAYLSIESEKVSFEKLLEEFGILERLGYHSFKAVQQETISSQTEPESGGEGVRVGQSFQPGSSGLFGKDLPGKWKTRGQILNQYRRIFALYKLFGDDGLLRRSLPGRAIRRGLEKVLRRPIPGWHDTHARHSSARQGGIIGCD